MTTTGTTTTPTLPSAQDYLNDAVGIVDRLTAELRAADAHKGPTDRYGRPADPQGEADERRALANAARARASAAVQELSIAGHEALATARSEHQAAVTGEPVDTSILAVVWPGVERALGSASTAWVGNATSAEIQAAQEFGPSAIRRSAGVGVEAKAHAEQRVADLTAALDRRATVLAGGEASAAAVAALGRVAQTVDGVGSFLAGGGAVTAARVASVGAQLRGVQLGLLGRGPTTR